MPVSAQVNNPKPAPSLDGYFMRASVMVDGGVTSAAKADSWVAMCSGIHETFDAYIAAQPWLEPDAPAEFVSEVRHRDTSDGAIKAVRLWISLNDPQHDLPGDLRIIRFCTQDQRGYLPVTAAEVRNKVDSPVVEVLDFEGEVYCEPGSAIVGSATYYYSWSDGQGRWVSGLGRNWVYQPNPDRLVSGEVEFRCVEILTEPDRVALLAERVPDSSVNINPSVKGLTGLDAWLWYDFTAGSDITLAVTVEARGGTWPLTVRAWIDEVMWDVDCTTNCAYRGSAKGFDTSGHEYATDYEDSIWDPAPAYDGGGESAEEALHTHVYRTHGDYTLSTATVWKGSYEFGGILNELDPVIVADSYSFPVISVVSDLYDR